MEPTTDVKLKFALLWLQNPEAPFVAAQKLFADPTKAFQHADAWVKDPEVLAEVERLKQDADENQLLPSKAAYAREILLYARQLRGGGAFTAKEAVAYDTLYASIRGHVEKPGANATVNNSTTVNRVMIQNNFGSNEQYATTLEAQQSALMHDNDAVT